MRAVVVPVREEELAERRSKGLDRWDEMWEGVLHLTPAPSLEHQLMLGGMIEFLGPLIRNAHRGTLVSVFRFAGSQYLAVQRAADGSLASDTLSVRFLRVEKVPPQLRIDDLGDSSRSVEI